MRVPMSFALRLEAGEGGTDGPGIGSKPAQAHLATSQPAPEPCALSCPMPLSIDELSSDSSTHGGCSAPRESLRASEASAEGSPDFDIQTVWVPVRFSCFRSCLAISSMNCHIFACPKYVLRMLNGETCLLVGSSCRTSIMHAFLASWHTTPIHFVQSLAIDTSASTVGMSESQVGQLVQLQVLSPVAAPPTRLPPSASTAAAVLSDLHTAAGTSGVIPLRVQHRMVDFDGAAHAILSVLPDLAWMQAYVPRAMAPQHEAGTKLTGSSWPPALDSLSLLHSAEVHTRASDSGSCSSGASMDAEEECSAAAALCAPTEVLADVYMRLERAAFNHLWHLAAGAHCLRVVNLSGSALGADGVHGLATALLYARAPLEEVYLSRVLARDSQHDNWAPALRALGVTVACSAGTSLRALSLAGNLIADRACAELAALLDAAAELEQLDISENSISDVGAAALALALTSHLGIRELSVGGNAFECHGVAAILSALPNTEVLQELAIEACSLTDEGAAALAEQLHDLSAVRVLALGDNPLSSSAAVTLAAGLRGCHSLEELRLPRVGMRATGFAAICEAVARLPRLAVVEVDAAAATGPGLRSLRALERALPDVQVCHA